MDIRSILIDNSSILLRFGSFSSGYPTRTQNANCGKNITSAIVNSSPVIYFELCFLLMFRIRIIFTMLMGKNSSSSHLGQIRLPSGQLSTQILLLIFQILLVDLFTWCSPNIVDDVFIAEFLYIQGLKQSLENQDFLILRNKISSL